MILEELSAIYNPWCTLQQPLHSHSGLHDSFLTLLAAIDQGWEVVEPVQVMPPSEGNAWTYYWMLTRPNHVMHSILFVPALPEVERFIEQNHYQVIEGSYY